MEKEIDMKKGTNLELFERVLEQLQGDVKEEFAGYVEGYVSKNEKVAAHRAEKRVEANAELVSVLKNVLNDTPKTRDAILVEVMDAGVKEVGGKAITAQKISSILADMGANKTEIKDGKKKKVAYTA